MKVTDQILNSNSSTSVIKELLVTPIYTRYNEFINKQSFHTVLFDRIKTAEKEDSKYEDRHALSRERGVHRQQGRN